MGSLRGALAALITLACSIGLLAYLLRAADFAAMRTAAADLAPLSLALIFGGMLTSILLGALRFKLIARDAGSDASFAGILHAVCIGQLAGAALFQVFGRLLARGAILRRSGLSVSTSTLVTLYEQLLALAVSVGLAVAGALYI